MEIDMKMMEHVLKLWLPGVFGSTWLFSYIIR
jgi:hypothetical protein